MAALRIFRAPLWVRITPSDDSVPRSPPYSGAMLATDMTERQFRELFNAVSNWGRWDDDGQRGALNHLTPVRVAAAARLVGSGETVTLGQPLRTDARIDLAEPVHFAKDYVGIDYHNDGHSHITAFC